jgi:hypothetical protein
MKAMKKVDQKIEEKSKKRCSAPGTELSGLLSKKRRGDQTDFPFKGGSTVPLVEAVDVARPGISAEALTRDSKLLSERFRLTNQFQISGHDGSGGLYACPAPMTSFDMTPFTKRLRKGAIIYERNIDQIVYTVTSSCKISIIQSAGCHWVPSSHSNAGSGLANSSIRQRCYNDCEDRLRSDNNCSSCLLISPLYKCLLR